MFKPTIPCAAALSLVFAIAAEAGTATITTDDGGTATFEYSKTMLRIGSADPSSYAVVRDGSVFAVTTANGQPMVMDAGAMMRNMAGAGPGMPQMAPADLDAEFLGLESTGRKETVAGIIGEVYLLRTRDNAGQERVDEAVLSTDARAREFRDALFLMLNTVKDSASEQSLAQSENIMAQLEKMNAGVLRFGTEMVITAIDSSNIDPSRFDLPAPPMSLEGLGNMLGNMGAMPPPRQ